MVQACHTSVGAQCRARGAMRLQSAGCLPRPETFAVTRKLVLLRHGQSQWNLDNRFTGWVDVDLTEQGRREAAAAGR